MSNPIRERIIQAITTRVGGTRKLEAYDDRDLPMTVVVESEDAAQEADYDRTNVVLPLVIARAISLSGEKDDAWLTAANLALGNLITEIYTGDETLGGLCHGIDYTGGTVEILPDGAKGAAVQCNVQVRYSFLHGNPFLTEEPA